MRSIYSDNYSIRISFETLKDKIHNCITDALNYYETHCKKELSIEDLCVTTALEPSISEYMEWLQLINIMYEKEYLLLEFCLLFQYFGTRGN